MSGFSIWHRFLEYWERQTPTTRGVLLMCISTICASTMHALVRQVSLELPPIQVAFFRNLAGLVVLFPLLVKSRFRIIKTNRIGMHALRGLFNIFAMFMFFTGLSLTTLAKANALNFTAPIFAALLSVVFLGERVRLYRWLAIVMGFAGMLIILRPGFTTVDTGSLLVVGSAALWAIAMIIIKILSRTESSLTIVAWMGISMCILSIGPALWVWQPMTVENLLWLLLVGVFGTIAQVSISQSLKEADPTAVLPFDFLKMIWASVLGYWFFAETPDIFTWIGAAVIFSSGMLIVFRERNKAPAPTPHDKSRHP